MKITITNFITYTLGNAKMAQQQTCVYTSEDLKNHNFTKSIIANFTYTVGNAKMTQQQTCVHISRF